MPSTLVFKARTQDDTLGQKEKSEFSFLFHLNYYGGQGDNFQHLINEPTQNPYFSNIA